MNSTIRQTALAWLTRRDYSQYEIAQKLKTKGHANDIIEPIIANLVQAGLINDQRFVENYIHWRRKKGHGPMRIAMELQARGIAKEMIAEQLHITDNAWLTDVRHTWQKKFKGKLPMDNKNRARQIRFLQYKGFTHEQINSVLHNPE